LEALGINLGYVILQIVNFIILLLLLRLLLYGPVLNMLQERKERIAEGLNNAREAEAALARAEADRQAILDEARAEAQRITGEARQRAEEAAKAIQAEARQDAARITEQARNEATAERDRQLGDLRDHMVSLSIAAANHLIATGLDEQRQRQLVENFFTSVPKDARRLGDSMTVITAIPLTDSEKSRFGQALGSAELTFRTDPTILGGVVLRSGAQEIDASFRSQLTGLRQSMS
jgi:F-type H+-transporting ATPase subunit b